MNKYLILDVETTIGNEGDPFDPRNKLCLVGLRSPSYNRIYSIQYSNDPYGDALAEIKTEIENSKVLVGFNLKFDLHWIRRYINDINFFAGTAWDCQLVEFLLSSQRLKYPSLNEVCGFYNLGHKLDAVATDYWEHGIDTTLVPIDLLTAYLTQDLVLTEKLFLTQQEHLQKRKSQQFRNLCALHNADMLVLQEMEFNGIKVDLEKINEETRNVLEKLEQADKKLRTLSNVPNEIPLNLSSNFQLSAIIYGGFIPFPVKVNKTRVYKNGTVREYEVKGIDNYKVEGFANPIKSTETAYTVDIPESKLIELQTEAKENNKAIPFRKYSVDEATLKQIKPTNKRGREFLDLLFYRIYYEQTLSTYLNKIPEMIEGRHWENNIIHGQFNQCVARTGRLSSSKPNLQNLDTNLHHFFISRYAN